jgi:lipid-A-disaccharide synthase
MADPIRMFIVAGEPSGDRLGAALVHDLRHHRPVDISGVGGSLLVGEGLDPIFPMSDIAVMGMEAVIRRLPLVLWRVLQTAIVILRARPEIVVLIDAQVFNRFVARLVRTLGFRNPILLYVAPTVWGYAPERARKIKPLYDEILAILPFEPVLMEQLGGPETHYVGHVATRDAAPPHTPLDQGLVGLMPGSRDREIVHHLPVMRACVEALKDHHAVTGFYLPALPAAAERLREAVADWPAPVEIVTKASDKSARAAQAVLAIATAGTVSLELALAGLPMVLFYAPDGKFLELAAKGQLFALPNIILGEEIVPEEVGAQPSAEVVIEQARSILNSAEARQAQVNAFLRLHEMIVTGTPEHPRENPADRILAHLAD